MANEPSAGRSRRITTAGLVLGIGLGGFVDGVVLHQLLQWHHMGTGTRASAPGPGSTAWLEDNTRWDGLFHAAAWVVTVVGLFLLWRALERGHTVTWRSLAGLLLAGWGLFDVVEGIVDHQILGVHHVRDDLGGPLSWDLGFLMFGLALVAVGYALVRSDESARSDVSRPPGPATLNRDMHDSGPV